MRARTTLLVTALTLAASGAGGSVVAATPGPTPDEGLAGACNMTNSHAAFGMFTIAGSLGEPSRVRRRHDHRHPQHQRRHRSAELSTVTRVGRLAVPYWVPGAGVNVGAPDRGGLEGRHAQKEDQPPIRWLILLS